MFITLPLLIEVLLSLPLHVVVVVVVVVVVLSIEGESADFDNFLELLGDKIALKGWEGYRGGLDVKSEIT